MEEIEKVYEELKKHLVEVNRDLLTPKKERTTTKQEKSHDSEALNTVSKEQCRILTCAHNRHKKVKD